MVLAVQADEADVLRRARQGDEAAFEELVHRCQEGVRRRVSEDRMLALVGGCCDGTLAPEESAELASLIAADTRARETAAAALFVDRLLAHALAPQKADLIVVREAPPRHPRAAPGPKRTSLFLRITVMAASFAIFAVTLWTVLNAPQQPPPKADAKAPPRLDLKVGDRLDYTRSATVALDLEAEIDGKKVKGTHTLTLDVGYRLVVATADGGLTFDMSITSAKLAQKMTGFDTNDESWELPAGKSVAFTLTCDVRGRIIGTSGESLRVAFQGAGCPSRLAKIPEVYLFGIRADGRGRDGAYAEGGILPENTADAWSVSVQRAYGPGSLLDDFSVFEERWDAKVRTVEGGRVKSEVTLADAKLIDKAPALTKEERTQIVSILDADLWDRPKKVGDEFWSKENEAKEKPAVIDEQGTRWPCPHRDCGELFELVSRDDGKRWSFLLCLRESRYWFQTRGQSDGTRFFGPFPIPAKARGMIPGLTIDAKSGGGTVELDAKTGVLQSARFKHSIGFSGTIEKNAAKGTITRTETVTRR